MVLAVQFNSFVHPIAVMVALPFTVTGAFLSLLITHNSINLYSLIGILVLMGITLKNSILLVEFFNKQRREHGLGLREAILTGAPIRLRPIVMTSAATVAAAVVPGAGHRPGRGGARGDVGGDHRRRGRSTAFSLLVVPCLYDLLAPHEDRSRAAREELDAAEEAEAGVAVALTAYEPESCANRGLFSGGRRDDSPGRAHRGRRKDLQLFLAIQRSTAAKFGGEQLYASALPKSAARIMPRAGKVGRTALSSLRPG